MSHETRFDRWRNHDDRMVVPGRTARKEAATMRINTTRFGRLDIDPHERLLFPLGILGLEDCCEWVLLADAENDALGWLQSTARREIALAVVSPRRFVPGY